MEWWIQHRHWGFLLQEGNPTSPGLASCRNNLRLTKITTDTRSRKERNKGDETVVKQQSYCQLKPWQLKRFLDASIYPLLAQGGKHGGNRAPATKNSGGRHKQENQTEQQIRTEAKRTRQKQIRCADELRR
jgi:hypothetical protein